MDWLRDNAALIIGFFGMVGVLWTGWVKLRGDDDTDDAKLRTDLMKTVTDLSADAHNLRTEIRDMRAAHKTDIAAIRAEAATERETLERAAVKQLADIHAQMALMDEANRELRRQVIGINQQMMNMRGEVQGLQNREYIHHQYLQELQRQGELLFPYEWQTIKDAADRIVPRPVWPALDAIVPDGEDDARE